MQLVPYIFFYGRCEEALEFYKTVFGGSYDLQRVEGSPAASQMPPGSGNRVMHASFTAGDLKFMASDGRDDKAVDADTGNVSLALETSDGAEGERIFNALAGGGGNVAMPLGEAYWGGRFGMVVDRFGTEWLLSTP